MGLPAIPGGGIFIPAGGGCANGFAAIFPALNAAKIKENSFKCWNFWWMKKSIKLMILLSGQNLMNWILKF